MRQSQFGIYCFFFGGQNSSRIKSEVLLGVERSGLCLHRIMRYCSAIICGIIYSFSILFSSSGSQRPQGCEFYDCKDVISPGAQCLSAQMMWKKVTFAYGCLITIDIPHLIFKCIFFIRNVLLNCT